MQKIGPCLWFDGQAEEAAKFYVSIFKNSKIVETIYSAEGMPLPAGSVLTVRFVLDGEEFVALNGGPQFKFSPAISFVASCETQDEVDYLWKKLSEGGREDQCGWLTDKYGVSWQVVPKLLIEMLRETGSEASRRAVAAMMKMAKLDISTLKKAYDNA